MKHLLPILTLAFLCAATTASAAYYYDYYLDPQNTEPVDNDPPGYHNQSDTFTYAAQDNSGNASENSNVYTLSRESNWGNDITRYGNKDNFYRIDIGKENTGSVTLFLTDYVSEVVPQAAYLPTHSSSNAIFNMNIVEYGYRTLTYDESSKKYIAGDTTVKEIFTTDDDGNKILNSANVTPIDTINYYGDSREMTRYKYELGTFDAGTIIEVYMKDSAGREVYSFSSFGTDADDKDVYTPFDKNSPSEDVVSQGGFGDGGYTVNPRQIDLMLYSYYFVEELPVGVRDPEVAVKNPDYHDYTKFDNNYTLASGKAMPLSALLPVGNVDGFDFKGKEVSFGIIGVTAVGSPLPGGLPIALIAGLFGLGFYVRRRKAIVG